MSNEDEECRTRVDLGGENGAETYRMLCEPFSSVGEANAAMGEFQRELYELRKKHGVRDLLFVIEIPLRHQGREFDQRILGVFGDESKAEGMAAWAFGRTQAERQERVSAIVAAAAEAVRGGKRSR